MGEIIDNSTYCPMCHLLEQKLADATEKLKDRQKQIDNLENTLAEYQTQFKKCFEENIIQSNKEEKKRLPATNQLGTDRAVLTQQDTLPPPQHYITGESPSAENRLKHLNERLQSLKNVIQAPNEYYIPR